MRKIEEVLRLHFSCSRSNREIASAIRVSPTTVGDYVRRAKLAGLRWPLPEGMTEATLEAALFPVPLHWTVQRPEPDWTWVHRELRRKGVTLDLLWQEYREQSPDGYQYSWFCERYRAFAKALPVTLRQTHAPGERLFVDYAGQTIAITDPGSGEIRQAQLFVAVLGASNYTFAEATWTQSVADWIGSHVRTFEFIGGCTELVVPDNLKAGVKHPSFYDPDLNPSYREMAEHYDTAILPARVRKPRDKAKVEVGVQIAERWILARLRHRTFFTLAEVNQAIQPLLARLNNRPFKQLEGCRQSAFERLDRPALRPLPAARYEVAEWKQATAGIDYHVEVCGHYYSVPYHYARQKVEVRFTASTIEVFLRGERIASHVRSALKGRHTTVAAHLAPAHQQVAGWNAPRFRHWAARIGPHTERLIERLLTSRAHPQQAYRSCLGILRLAKDYGADRLEAACEKALGFGALSYRSLASMLKHGLDQKPPPKAQAPSLPAHINVRGADYYH